MMSLLPMRRRLCRRRDGIVALVAMASVPLPMRRRLAVVDNDGDSATGDRVAAHEYTNVVGVGERVWQDFSKRNSHRIFQEKSSCEIFKRCSRQSLQYKNTNRIYQPASAGNLQRPARWPVLGWDTTLVLCRFVGFFLYCASILRVG